ADEQVERGHDRHVDERVREVRRVRGRHHGAEQRNGDHDDHRTEHLLQLDGPPHTRSTTCPRVNRPPGRTSSTRIPAPNTKDGMYWLWLVGSAPPSSPVAKPIEKPPSVAGIRRFMPPSTTPARTMI